MDDQQHALAGLLRTIPIVAAARPGSRRRRALGLALGGRAAARAQPGPGRVRDPARGRSPREVAGLAAVGGALGGLAVCAAAALGDPLLDALDVSEPAFRLAAGIVAVLAGAADLLRRPPAPEPALAGRRAALVPVAIPVVARPALLVMALGAGADHGVAVSAGAMALGVALLTALAAGCPTDGPGGRALRWAGRVMGAGLVAAGVLLGVDGIFDV